MKRGPSALDIVLLLVQLLLMVLYFWQPDFVLNSLGDIVKVIGAIPMLVGAIFIVWALVQMQNVFSFFASPKENGKLITTGIFGYVRHPIYSGLILLGIGYSFFDIAEALIRIVVALLLTLFFHFKAGLEERRLEKLYPEYAEYKAHTGKFLPTFLRYKVSRVKEQSPEVVQVKEIAAPTDPVEAGEDPPLTWGDG